MMWTIFPCVGYGRTPYLRLDIWRHGKKDVFFAIFSEVKDLVSIDTMPKCLIMLNW